MLTHDGKVGFAPAATAIAVIAAIAGSLWWKTHEEPQAVSAAAIVPVAAPALPAPPQPPGAVIAFVDFASAGAPETLPLDHGYTSRGLEQLADALAALGGNTLWTDRALRLRQSAEALARDPDSLEHADLARDAFTQAAEWLADLEGGGEGVLQAARGIDVDAPLSSQDEAVARFFREAARMLRPEAPSPGGESRA